MFACAIRHVRAGRFAKSLNGQKSTWVNAVLTDVYQRQSESGNKAGPPVRVEKTLRQRVPGQIRRCRGRSPSIMKSYDRRRARSRTPPIVSVRQTNNISPHSESVGTMVMVGGPPTPPIAETAGGENAKLVLLSVLPTAVHAALWQPTHLVWRARACYYRC